MDQNNSIFECSLTKKKISLVDSFVLNKLGEGHGESTLYLGGKTRHEDIAEVFKNAEANGIKLFFSKENILGILNCFKPYYLNQHGFYLNNGELLDFKNNLKEVFTNEVETINKKTSIFSEDVELLDADSQGRIYMRVESSSILRRVFLPHSVYCVILIHINNDVISPFCKFYPELEPIKKNIKYKNKKMKVEIDYFKRYE
jgi:hypothetical protein